MQIFFLIIMKNKLISFSLLATTIIGAFGIPLGDPKFFLPAISLELIFGGLFILSLKKLNYILIPSIIITIIVIIGNTISPKHIEIMSTFTPIGNAIVLILGGYVFQGLILYSGVKTLYHKKITR